MNSTTAYLKLQNAIENAREIPPCQVTDPDAWFPNYKDHENGDFRAAKRMCAVCPVVQQCLEYALIAREEHGVWGGLTPKERGRMLSAKKRLSSLR